MRMIRARFRFCREPGIVLSARCRNTTPLNSPSRDRAERNGHYLVQSGTVFHLIEKKTFYTARSGDLREVARVLSRYPD